MKLCNELTRVIDLNLNSSLEITKMNNIDVIREAYQKVYQSDLKEGKRYLLSKIEDVFLQEKSKIEKNVIFEIWEEKENKNTKKRL